MIYCVDDTKEGLYLSAYDQSWDEATLKQLKDEYGIIFMTNGRGVTPVMIKGDVIYLGWEDDGCICFEKEYGCFQNGMHKLWIPYLIADLQEALKLMEAT